MNESGNYPSDAKMPLAEITSATRHLFLCAGPDCCDPAVGEALWSVLKAETRRLSVPVLRTKASCLRVCKTGPWLVVYPDGIWYGELDADKLRRILKEHIEGGKPVRRVGRRRHAKSRKNLMRMPARLRQQIDCEASPQTRSARPSATDEN